nr:RecName: Full=Omega-lycotoxin-Lp1a; Short=Omega-LCTX-Lp1a; AltName: Full=Omega-lycotoxin Gsp(267)1e; Short=OLG1e [Lycosa praegrandis]
EKSCITWRNSCVHND